MDATLAKYRDIFEKKTFCYVATVGKDGTTQVTPVWIDFDGTDILFNTAEGRQKTRNLDRDGHVALSVTDEKNPYRYIQVRGEVVSRTREGAEEHIDALAKKYMGVDRYPMHNPEEPRVIYRIRPLRVQTMG